MDHFTIIFYHAYCDDGWASRMIAEKHYGKENAIYVSVAHHEFAKFEKGGDYWKLIALKDEFVDVVFVDIVPHPEQVVAICAISKSVVVLDHHKTAVEEWERYDGVLPSNLTTIFKMDRSGTGLMWEYLFPDKPMPKLYQYVQDNDLWTHKLPDVKALIRLIRSQPYDVAGWNFLEESFEQFLHDMVSQGNAIEQFFQQSATDTIKLGEVAQKVLVVSLFKSGYDDGSATPGSPEMFNANVVNAPRVFCSDIANEIAGGNPNDFGMTWYVNKNNVCVLSLRSKPTGADVAKIAEVLGGGGHKHASGANLPVDSQIFKDLVAGKDIILYCGPDPNIKS